MNDSQKSVDHVSKLKSKMKINTGPMSPTNFKNPRQNDLDAQSYISQTIDNIRNTVGSGRMPETLSAQRSPTLAKAMKREVSLKHNEGLNRLYEQKANAESNIFETMMQETDPFGGKKLFKEQVNISDAANMHSVETDLSVLRGYNEPKHGIDYADKSKIIYEPPPVVKNFKERHSFVHNQVQNKTKTNNEHYNDIIGSKILNQRKFKILKQLHEESVDFRIMTSFKNVLFESDLLKENHLLPMDEWERIRKYETYHFLDKINDSLVAEIRRPDGYINLHKFMHILDLFTLLPISKT